MVLYRMRERRLIIGIVAAIGLFALGVGVGDSAQHPVQEPNQRLQELMTERCEILKSEVESVELSLKSGRADLAEWREANVALFKAKADLAADVDEQITIYEEMVDFVRTCEQNAKRIVDAGQAPQTELRQARLATIEAQIALEQLRMAKPQ
jgi:hypothetical protein